MNIDQYFKTRADLVGRTLAETDEPFARDWRFFVAGVLCVAVATSAELWASSTQSDAGFFARTSTFLALVLLAGVWLLSIAQASHVYLAGLAVKSRDAVRERILTNLLRIDGALANKALRRIQ